MFSQGMIIGAIYRDLCGIKVYNRKEKYGNLLYNLEDTLLVYLQEDIIDPKTIGGDWI